MAARHSCPASHLLQCDIHDSAATPVSLLFKLTETKTLELVRELKYTVVLRSRDNDEDADDELGCGQRRDECDNRK